MNCSSCNKEIVPGSFFCPWCNTYTPFPEKGAKAGIFARWVAMVIDPLIAVFLWLVASSVFGAIMPELGLLMALLFPLLYFVWFLLLLKRGLTPGKKLLGLQVVETQTGAIPGFGKMFVREIFGRILSGLFFGLSGRCSTKMPKPGMTSLQEQ